MGLMDAAHRKTKVPQNTVEDTVEDRQKKCGNAPPYTGVHSSVYIVGAWEGAVNKRHFVYTKFLLYNSLTGYVQYIS